MEVINDELRIFVKDVTLFLQKVAHNDMDEIEPMFQRAYKLYVKYDVENEPVVEADAESRCPLYVDYKKSCAAWQNRQKELNRTA